MSVQNPKLAPKSRRLVKNNNSIWIREFEDGSWELGLLTKEPYGWQMNVDDFCYFFYLDLSKWQYVGLLDSKKTRSKNGK
jgi:hypothetical protein